MKASKIIGVSQPSLSSQLKILESNINVKLFQKVGRANQLTRQGTVLFGYCQRMFDLSEEMSEVLLERSPSATRKVYIGVSEEIERSFVVEAVSLFLLRQNCETRPKVIIISGTESQLIERLKFNELDIVVSEKIFIDTELHVLSKIKTPVMLAHSSSDKIIINTKTQWVMPSNRFKLRSEIDNYFESNKLKGRIILESDVMASVVRSVVDKIGIGFFPLLYISQQIKDQLIHIIGPSAGYWNYHIWLFCNQKSLNDNLIQAFTSAFNQVSLNLNIDLRKNIRTEFITQ